MRRLLAALSLASIVACDTTAPLDRIAGSYALQTIDGQPPPVVSTTWSDGSVHTSQAQRLVLDSGLGTWSWKATAKVTSGAESSTEEFEAMFGSWTLYGSRLTLAVYQYEDGFPAKTPTRRIDATISGDLLTFTDFGKTYVFKR